MAEIIKTANPLPPPACGYASEQARFDAYVEALGLELVGGIEWQASVEEPDDLSLHWLKLDADGRAVSALEYSDADARYVRWISLPALDGAVTGAGNAFALTFSPSFNLATGYHTGRRYVFVANHTITGAATLEVDGLGVIQILKHGGSALETGDIVSGQVVDVVISGTSAWLQTPTAPPAATAAVAVLKFTGANGTNPQTITAGVVTAVQWNTAIDPSDIVDLSATQIELETGTYLIDISVPVTTSGGTADVVLILYDATASANIATNSNQADTDDESSWAHLKHVVSVTAASNNYEVRFYSNDSVTLGQLTTTTDYDETYQQMSIIKL